MSSAMRIDEEEDAAAKAYASISLQLKQFTSPKLAKLSSASRLSSNDDMDHSSDVVMGQPGSTPGKSYELDTMEWMQQELQEVPYKAPLLKTPKRTPLLERAGTPVMSNSSTKRDPKEDQGTPDEVMAPVQTPAFKPIPRPKIASPRAISAPAAIPTSTNNVSQSPFVYRRYHDTLHNYLKAKRSLSHRMDLEKQSQTLEAGDAVAFPTADFSYLAPQEQRVELEYLAQLQQLCWSNPSPETFLEGDSWMLLQTLRQLGPSALVWNNDQVSALQYARVQASFIQQLATQIQDSPQDILKQLASDQAPMVLQRRYVILQWIQTCLDQVRVEPTSTKPRPLGTHPDDEAPSLVPETVQQNMLESSLCYILAGRLEDAKNLARSIGQPWRAASWSGGEASGLRKTPNPMTQKVDLTPTGNTGRFLWKRQIWNNGRRLCNSAGSVTSSKHTEGAICSVLANDVSSCLANPALRNWSRAFGATWMALWGRLEDEVLHAHNNNRRNQSEALPFPGTQFQKQESEQLLATAQLSGISDAQAMQLLTSSPFPELRGSGPYERAMAAFCLGKSAILEYCATESTKMTEEAERDDDSFLAQLRFLTHLTLFLDSLQDSTTPTLLHGLTNYKDQVLFLYVQYLDTRPELWHLIALYVSILPEALRLQWYPTMLAKVLQDSERRSMLESMQELFPQVLVPILNRTVRLCLAAKDASDEMKCNAVQWLLYHDNHSGDALICANILLRDFFLTTEDDKMEVAMSFVENNLPEDLVERAGNNVSNMSGESAEIDQFKIQVDNACTEHLAFSSYLNAYRTFGKWKDLMESTPTTVSDGLANIDLNNLNATERAIAKERLDRDWTRQKKNACQTILDAAKETRHVLYNVLTHPGGWLSPDDGSEMSSSDMEETTRQKDIAEIRSRYLVLAVNLYHEVCHETAVWLSRSLDDAPSKEAAELLKDKSYQPDVWYQYALDLATLVAEDRHGIHQAISVDDLTEILAKLGETAVSKLMGAAK